MATMFGAMARADKQKDPYEVSHTLSEDDYKSIRQKTFDDGAPVRATVRSSDEIDIYAFEGAAKSNQRLVTNDASPLLEDS